MIIDDNFETRKDLILEEYSILVTDSVREIEIKKRKLHCDVI